MKNSSRQLEYAGKDLEAMSFARNYHRWIIDSFKPFLKGNIAEVGAGSGNFSKLVLEYLPEIQLLSFEPSINMYRKLRLAQGTEPRWNALNCFYGERASEFNEVFDAVLYVNVLEHIEDHHAELRSVRPTLKPGGHLCIFVPALPFLYSELDASIGHFRRYTKHELVELVTSIGFRITQVHYMDIIGILPWYLAFVLMKRKITGGNVSLYDKIVIPPMRLVEKIFPIPIGKNLMLVAEK